MRRGGFLLFVLLLAVIVFGYYRGWFSVNKDAVERDKETATEKLKEGGEKIKEGATKLKDDFNKGTSSTTATK